MADPRLADAGLVAILRGIVPVEAVAIGETLLAAGIPVMEVPLNSPSALESIAALCRALGASALVGAGTVLTPDAVQLAAAAGARFIVAPNCDPAVIAAARAAGLQTAPGVFTPTEAFQALAAGADVLKLFPAEIAGPAGLKALRAVLPAETAVLAVGGVDAGNMVRWRQAGATGFGIGSALFRPGDSASLVGSRAQILVSAFADGERS